MCSRIFYHTIEKVGHDWAAEMNWTDYYKI